VRDASVLSPGLGFLGTVVGISIAIGGLPTAMQDRNLEGLMGGLRTAFDTTFFGLVGSLLLSLLVLSLQAISSKARLAEKHSKQQSDNKSALAKPIEAQNRPKG
jgi:biopolymer transport protein ExbB/TolQ